LIVVFCELEQSTNGLYRWDVVPFTSAV